MESIRDWLNSSRNYNVGLALYLAHGTNDALKTALKQGESQFRKDKLLAALHELWEGQKNLTLPSPQVERVLPAKSTAIKLPISGNYTSTQPDHDKDPYYHDWQPLYKEMMHLRSKLPLYPNDDERGAAAFRILFLEKTCRKFWRMRDYFFETGQEMPEDTGKPDPFAEFNKLHSRLMTLRTYKTREKKALKKDPLNVKAKTRLDKWEKEMKEIELKLEEK